MTEFTLSLATPNDRWIDAEGVRSIRCNRRVLPHWQFHLRAFSVGLRGGGTGEAGLQKKQI